MTKNLLATLFFIAVISSSSAQTAVDFTSDDCNSISHTLFSTLDSGKVVVMAWVMPCSSCIGPSLTAYNISQSYSSSNPGKVEFYLLDDVGDNSCSYINGWAGNYNIGPNMFSFSNTSLHESIYGSGGMPKIVIVGGANHTQYFNQNGAAAGNQTAIQSAIDLALSEVATVNETASDNFSIDLFPNPVCGKLSLTYFVNSHEEINIQLINSIGEVLNEVSNQNLLKGLNQWSFNTNQLATGIYFVRLSSASGYSLKKFIVD